MLPISRLACLIAALFALAPLQGPASEPGRASDPPTLAEALLAEVRAVEQSDPDRWAAFSQRVAEALEAYRKRTEHWMGHKPPPPPDILDLGSGDDPLPLCYLARRMLEGEGRDRWVFSQAIAHAPDPRGREFLLEEIRAGHDLHHRLARDLAATLPRARAPKVIDEEIERGATATSVDLAFLLLSRFADSLPRETVERALRWLEREFPGGPSNGQSEAVWTLRLALGGGAQRDAIAPYLEKDSASRLYALFCLREQPGRSPAVAACARREIARDGASLGTYERGLLGSALLHADPAGAVREYLDRLHSVEKEGGKTRDAQGRVVSRTAAYEELAYLLGGLASVDLPVTRSELARLAFAETLEPMHRAHAILALAQFGDPGIEALVERWEATVPPQYREYVRRERRRLAASGR